MPIYEYVCKKCEREFVVEHEMSDKKTDCSEVDQVCTEHAEIEKAMYAPSIKSDDSPPVQKNSEELSRDQIERNVHEGIEEMRDFVKKEKEKARMKIDIDELRKKK